MAEIFPINENTWRIEDSFVRMFVLEGEESALLIDGGMSAFNARELAEQITAKPITMILTHADRDHVAGTVGFDSFFMHPSEASNFYNAQKQEGCFVAIENGQRIDLGNREIEIVHLPGHTPGSIALLDVKGRMLFSGDSVQDGDIYMFGEQREIHAYRSSMEKLQHQMSRFDTVYPSHGSVTVEKDIIPKLLEAADIILSGNCSCTDMEMRGMTVRRYDATIAGFLLPPIEEN